MEIKETGIPGLLIIQPKVFSDQRGYFFESYNQKRYEDSGQSYHFVQDNESKSTHGVVRGLHYQLEPHAQAKLVRVIQGTVFDVAVDLRKGSPTFGQWHGIMLSAENKIQFLIPKGFAHGFAVLSEEAIFYYKCDHYYNPGSERGIAYDDPALGIDWQIPKEKAVVSGKDQNNPLFNEAEMNFTF